MQKFKNDDEFFKFIREHLYVAAVCDILDDSWLLAPGNAPPAKTAAAGH